MGITNRVIKSPLSYDSTKGKLKQWSYDSEGKKVPAFSLTKPGQTQGLRELLERYSSGQSIRLLKGEYEAAAEAGFDQIFVTQRLENMSEIEKLQYTAEIRHAIAQFRAGQQAVPPQGQLAPQEQESSAEDEASE